MKIKKALDGSTFKARPPKKTHQGQGVHSLPKPGRKRNRGQGR